MSPPAEPGFTNVIMNYYNYFTEIEEHFVKRRGKHLLLSPMDWGLIASWRDAGVPLQVALRGIDIAMDSFMARQRRGSAKVNSLCYCHDSVMAEFANYAEAHVGEHIPDTQADSGDEPAGSEAKDESLKNEVLGLVAARISEIKALSAKHTLSGPVPESMDRVLARLEEIMQSLEAESRVDPESVERDLGMVDRLLMEGLGAALAPEERVNWEKEAKKELKIYRKRLPKETYEKILANFMHSKIHSKFGVGELSLFHL